MSVSLFVKAVLAHHSHKTDATSFCAMSTMGSLTIVTLFAVVLIAAYSEAASGSCPLPSKVYSCSPKCQQTYDCSHGKACCPNSCNAKSCVDLATVGGGNNDKYSQSGGSGIYCNNQKCSPSEKCKIDPATKRMKCMRA